MSGPKAHVKMLEGIVELLCDEVDAKPDDEIFAQIREEGKDPAAYATEIREVLLEQIRRNRVSSTQQQLQAHKEVRGARGRSLLESPSSVKYALPSVPSGAKSKSPTCESSFVHWTNDSVAKFARGKDPLITMSERAENLIIKAVERGWKGPPYDPFKLADLLPIDVIPRADVADARTIDAGDGRPLIEFNPQLPISRIRFSIAHEIAHTFFPDCLERARYRARRLTWHDDDWQLELLCNVGAAELLMPAGSFSSLRNEGFDIVRLMDVRKKLGVSTEAILLRVTKLAKIPLACFVASARGALLRSDYIVTSPAWHPRPTGRLTIPEDSEANRCTAIGAVAKNTEIWTFGSQEHEVDVQAVGLPPYRQRAHVMRVAGLLRPKSAGDAAMPLVKYQIGDALQPIDQGPKVIAHIVNDATPRWGGRGFAIALKNAWPEIQEDFKHWASTDKSAFKLGAVRFGTRVDDIVVASMVAQHGYGPAPRPRIRYAALEECLELLAEFAAHEGRTVHMPKIGSGQAGGNWAVIEELIERIVCAKGVRVFVYQIAR